MAKAKWTDGPGALAHVTARCNWRIWHLKEPSRVKYLMQTMAESFERYSLDLLAFVVMSNHFHLVSRSPDPATYVRLTSRRTKCRHRRPYPSNHPNSTVLGQAMRRLMFMVSRHVQTDLGVTGKFWEAAYCPRPILDANSLVIRMAYDHRNPVRAGIVLRPEDYEWSSAGWWAETGDSPVPVLNGGQLPYKLDIAELRAAVLRFQRTRRLDDALEALRKKGLDWSVLTTEEQRDFLRDAGLAPLR